MLKTREAEALGAAIAETGVGGASGGRAGVRNAAKFYKVDVLVMGGDVVGKWEGQPLTAG